MLKKIKKLLLGTPETAVNDMVASGDSDGQVHDAAEQRQVQNEVSQESAQELPVPEPVNKPASTVNAVDRCSFLIEGIARALRPTAGAGGTARLTIWVNDPDGMDDVLVELPKFRKGLVNELYERGLDQYCSGEIVVQLSAPEENVKSLKIDDRVSISIGKKANPAPVSVAPEVTELRLKLLSGGQMTEAEYAFTGTPGKKSEINIGRQRAPMVNGVVKMNQVVVNDGEPDAETGAVSRRHARILYNGSRFSIQAYPGGCTSEGGASTRLCHSEDNAPSELTSSFAAYPLRNGDIIILGKKVSLQVSLS